MPNQEDNESKSTVYSSEEVRSIMEKQKQKWKEEYERRPKHPFKKGQYLWELNPQFQMTSMVKVVDCAPHILLVKNMDYPKGIPYRAKPEEFGFYTLISRKERYTLMAQSWAGKIVSVMERLSFHMYKIFNGQWTQEPKNLKDYVSNWLSFHHTFWSRVHCYIWDRESTWKSVMKDVTAHGPLWPGQRKKKEGV